MSGRGKSPKTLALIDAAARILKEIQPASVRAVCYRLFVMKLIPSVEKPQTNKVSRLLVDAREQGVIPWNWIVDETRAPESIGTWQSPSEIFEAAARQFRFDHWSMQDHHVEVWSEKGTVRGMLAPILNKYAVTLRVMHGHGSATSLYDAAALSLQSDKECHVIYVGDFDPSGMHMSEIDIPDRVWRYDGHIEFERVAIDPSLDANDPDVPSFSVEDKLKDPRCRWFRDQYGDRCQELDALSPAVLRQRVERAIRRHLDLDAWARAEAIEQTQRESMNAYVAGLPSILRQASKYGAASP